MVQWNAEKDQIILKGIFKFHDIKSSAPLLKYLAEQIGDDCTPKAVSHRLNNIRNHGKPLSSSTGTTPVKAVTMPKTPRSRAKASAKKLRTPMGTNESDNGEPEGFLESPSVKRGLAKRPRSAPKSSYAESEGSDVTEEEYTPFGGVKRVKTEPVEEEEELDVPLAVEEV